MPRFILIDNYSGYICGDTADLFGGAMDESPIDAAQRLDKSLNEPRPTAEVGEIGTLTDHHCPEMYFC